MTLDTKLVVRRSTAAPEATTMTELWRDADPAAPVRRRGSADLVVPDDPGGEGRPAVRRRGASTPSVGEMAPMLRETPWAVPAVGRGDRRRARAAHAAVRLRAASSRAEGMRALAERQRDGDGGQPVRHPGPGARGDPDRPRRLAGHDLSRRRCAGRRPSTPSSSSGWVRGSATTMRTPRRPPGPGPGPRRGPRPAVGPGRGDDGRGPVPGRADRQRLRAWRARAPAWSRPSSTSSATPRPGPPATSPRCPWDRASWPT